MNQSTEKVAVTLSHNQAVNGVEHVAGDTIEVDPRLARALKARGAAQIDSEARAAAAAAAPQAATVDDLRALAEKRGVALAGATRKADIQAALAAAPKTAADSAEKGGAR